MDSLVVRYTTDTAHPQDIVPIYVIHSIASPFCNCPDCWCHVHQARISQLLIALHRNELILTEEANLGDTPCCQSHERRA